MVILYGAPIVAWLVPRAARLCVSRLAIVARSLTSTFQRVPYRKYLAALGETATNLVLWPLRGIPHLVTRVSQRPMWAVGSIVASVLVLGFLVTTLRSTPQTYPVGDKALLETYTLHASHGNLSVGAYSRFRWNHPGPMYFYALAPLYALSGGREYSLDWTALFINLASAFALVTLLVRYGGWSFGFGMIAALSIYFFRPRPGPYQGFGALLSSPWNPHVPMLPLALLLVLCAGLASGRFNVLPAVVLVASFVIQTHVAMTPCVVAVVLVAALLLLTTHKRVIAQPLEAQIVSRGQSGFWISAATWLFILLWSLPLADQLQSGADGNLAAIARTFWSDSRFDPPSLATAFSALSYAFSAAIRPDARIAQGGPLSPSALDSSTGVWVLLQLALLTAACVWAVSKRRIFPAALCVLCLAMSGVAFWSITQVRGNLGDYLVFWMSIISAVNLGAIIGVFLSWVCDALHLDRIPSVAGRVAVVGFCSVLLFHGVSTVQSNHRQTIRGEARLYRQRELSRSLFLALEDELRRQGNTRPLIRIRQPAWSAAAGVILQRYKAGAPLAVEDRRVFMFTDVFSATGEEDVEFLFTDVGLQDDLSGEPPYRLVAQQGTLLLYTRALESSSADGPRPGSSLSD